MLTKENIIDRLRENKIRLSSFGVSHIGLFGSYVNGNHNSKSDIDILVDFKSDAETFLNFIELSYFLEDLFLGLKVDLVTGNGLSPQIGPDILKKVEYV